MKLIHLVPDEKFIQFIIDHFGKFDVHNQFLCLSPGKNKELKYLKPQKNLLRIEHKYFFSKQMSRNLNNCDCLIVHYLSPFACRAILAAPKSVKVIWSGWGGDYQNLIEPHGLNLYDKETKKVLKRHLIPKRVNLSQLRLSFKNIIKACITKLSLNRSIQRVDYFSAPIPDDYTLLKKNEGLHFIAEYLQLNYVSVEKTFMNGAGSIKGNNILVGNSSTATNNHIDIFLRLAELDLQNRKIIVPLSYGDDEYREVVIARGYEILGDSFYPLVNFMPLEAYNKIIATCQFAIMGHLRQQAIGNIGTMLFSGAKVFLDSKCVSYDFFNRNNIAVFDFKSSVKDPQVFFSELGAEQITENQTELRRIWSDKSVSNNIKNLLIKIKPEQ